MAAKQTKKTAKKPVKKTVSQASKKKTTTSTAKKETKKIQKAKKSIAVKNPGKVTQKSSPEKLSDVYTASGVRLTVKEAKFIDEYIASGNIRQSVIAAGYSGLPNCIGTQLMKKLYIAEEIQTRMSQREANSIADRNEIMQFFTDMMRGKILDQFDMPATNADKIKAGMELAKRSIDIEDRLKEKQSQTAPEIKISLDWGGNNGKKE